MQQYPNVIISKLNQEIRELDYETVCQQKTIRRLEKKLNNIYAMFAVSLLITAFVFTLVGQVIAAWPIE